MSIRSTVKDGIIFTEFSGEINYDVAIQQTEFIMSLKDRIVNQYELHDHTHTERINFSSNDIRKIAAYSIKTKDIFQHSFLAIYAPNDFTFGIARMFEAFFKLEGHPIDAGIFRDKEEAIQFLKTKMSVFG